MPNLNFAELIKNRKNRDRWKTKDSQIPAPSANSGQAL